MAKDRGKRPNRKKTWRKESLNTDSGSCWSQAGNPESAEPEAQVFPLANPPDQAQPITPEPPQRPDASHR